MKVWISEDDWYPFYAATPDERPHKVGAELSEEDYADWERVYAEFVVWQDRFAGLAPQW